MKAKTISENIVITITRRKLKVWASTEISDDTNRELRKISAETGKRMMFLYREAIEEYVERNKVILVEQTAQ